MNLTRILSLSAAAAVLAAAAVPAALPASAAPAPAESERVVYTQDFSGSGLPEGFTAAEGAWKVENGRLYGTSTSTGQLSRVTFGPHLENYRIEATLRFENVLNTSRWAAIALDIAPGGAVPYWIATMRSGSTAPNGLEFAERTAANSWNVTDTAAAPTAAGTGTDVRVAVEVRGRNATWIFNGTKVMETTRVVRSEAGILGLLANGSTVSYDDIVVTEIPATESLLVDPGEAPAVIAHRGYSSVIPENTLQALLSGGRAGADWIEMDVHTSSDGVPVVIHDATVDRTTAGTGDVSTLTSAQLAGLEAGSWFAPAYAGAKLPTLAEFLDQTKAEGPGLLLEVKGPETREQVQRVIDMLRERRMVNQTILQSFDTTVLAYAREYAPELRLGVLRGSIDADPVATARQLGVVTYNPSWSALVARPDAIRALHEAGIAVMPYTVDSPQQWTAMAAAGVDGIITNRPGALVGFQSAPVAPAPAAPTVAFAPGTDGLLLRRGDTLVPAVAAAHASAVTVTLDGAPVAEGARLATASLAAGAHVLRATATGPGGEASAQAAVTIEASAAGLRVLAVSEGVDAKLRDKLLKEIDKGDWAAVAALAEAAGTAAPAETAAVIAADARALGGL